MNRIATPKIDSWLANIIMIADKWARLSDTADKDLQYRKRALFVLFVVIGFCTLVVGVVAQLSVFRGPISILSSVLGMLGIVGGLFLLRYSDNPRKAGAYFTSALVLALVLPMFAFGGVTSSAAVLIVATPIGWGLLVSARSTGVFTTFLIAFLFVQEYVTRPDTFAGGQLLSDGAVTFIMIAIALLTSGAATSFYGIIVENTLKQLHKSSQETEFLATHDQLTGLPNRHAYYQKATALSESDFDNGLIFYALDLNGFKPVNDTYGHFVGDEILKIVAERLKRIIGEDGWAARMGGDEFVVISPYIPHAPKRFKTASRILADLSQPYEVGELSLSLSTSVGIAYSPEHGEDLNTLAINADLALFAAKRKTHRRWHIFDSKLKEKFERHRIIENRLRDAIKYEQLKVCYQPCIDNIQNQIVGFEALARWTDEQLGEVSPAEFINVAEKCGMISEIGNYVLRKACQDAAGWKTESQAQMPRVAVNVSPLQFTSTEFPKLVAQALEECQLEPGRLELEITETALMADTKKAIRTLKELDSLGVSIAVDDFGTGYSSLSYLKLFPIDRLKIDRSFIRDIENDPNDLAIVKAVVGLARSMELNVIAEGIENEQQAIILRRMGCFEMQGFLFSRPINNCDVETFVSEYARPHLLMNAPALSKLLIA